jgi:cytidine deaminase
MSTSREVLRLIEAAVSARKNAYCPYSRYAVGASVLTDNGRIFAGCNVENASYGLSLCAERVAIFNAVTRQQVLLKAIAIAGSAARPCGACRQVMFEFSTEDTQLYLVDIKPGLSRPIVTRTTVAKMLPFAFNPLTSGLLSASPRQLHKRRRG